MTITREINGEAVTITLTEEEIDRAIRENRETADLDYIAYIAETMEQYQFKPETIRRAAKIYREKVWFDREMNRRHWECGEYALKKALERQNGVC